MIRKVPVDNIVINEIVAKIDKLLNRIDNTIRLRRTEKRVFNVQAADNEIPEAVILIYTGRGSIPEYVKDCVEQMRLFDSSIPVYFVCGKKNAPDYLFNSIVVYEEDLILSNEHLEFLKKISHMNVTKFFQVTIERFFVLYDAMKTLGVKKCLHLENDNLLYANATWLIDRLSGMYERIATPRARDRMSCASIMFVPSQKALVDFLDFINNDSDDVFFNDMFLLPAYIDSDRGMTLPVVYNDYVDKYGLKTYDGKCISENEKKSDYCNHSEKLKGIFDCAPLGQYLDGCDISIYPNDRAGFINKETYIDPRNLTLYWGTDSRGRAVPFVYCDDKKYNVFNLHIHSKRLNMFRSDRIESLSNT